MMSVYKDVELKEATHIVFTDYGADPCIMGFANREDAEEYLNSLYTADGYDGTFDHYLVEVDKHITINHKKEST